MTLMWKPLVYRLDADTPHPYWALAACEQGGAVHYSRESQRSYALQAFDGAKDLAQALNRAALTPAQEGTTFGARDLPPGRFLSEDEILAAPRLTAEAHREHFLSQLGAASRKPKGPGR